MFGKYFKEKCSIVTVLFIIVITENCCQKTQQQQKQIPVKNYTICETKECAQLAQFYQETLNFSASPCDDFADFVCGKIHKQSEITAKRVENGVIGNLREEVKIINIKLLESPVVDNPKNALETARAYYQGCVEAEKIPKETVVNVVINILKDFGGMPLIPSTNYNPKIDYLQRITKVFRSFGSDILIGFEVGADLKNTSTRIAHFSQPEQFGIPRPHLVRTDEASQKIVNVYKTFVRNALCLIVNCEGQKTGNGIQDEVEKIVQFESQIAKITLPPEKRNDYTSRYKKLALKELKNKFPKVPWLSYVNGVFQEVKVHFKENNIVGFLDPEYYSQMGDLLEKTDKKTVANYIGWRIYQSIPVFNTQSLKNYTFVLSSALSGIKESPERTKICSDSTSENFPLSLGKIFLEKQFSPKVKAELEEFMKYLKIAVKNMLTKNEWMDDETKKQALKKLANIKHQIGYPKWLDNNLEKLEEEEGLPEPFDKKNYVESIIRMTKYRIKTAIQKLKKPIDREEWTTSPATVNAFYNSIKNMITFPAGILQPPLFQLNTLKSVNYGAIGSIIGHEILHGFDNVGNQFDETGNLRNWWTKKTRAEFVVRKKCYIDQYGNITDQQTGLQLNGELTVGENIADNGGIRGSFKAFEIANPHDERLPGLEQYSSKQIFFISFARSWCGKYRTEALRSRILTDSHTPIMYRTFMPPRNFKAFAEAFNCPDGSVMNPAHICRLW